MFLFPQIWGDKNACGLRVRWRAHQGLFIRAMAFWLPVISRAAFDKVPWKSARNLIKSFVWAVTKWVIDFLQNAPANPYP